MGRLTFSSLLHRSAIIRMAARAVVFAVFVGIVVGTARYIQTHITIDSVGTATGVVAAMVILTAALSVFVTSIFKNIA